MSEVAGAVQVTYDNGNITIEGVFPDMIDGGTCGMRDTLSIWNDGALYPPCSRCGSTGRHSLECAAAISAALSPSE